MDIIITIIYIVLFIIMMVFVFSIAMLKPFMSKKEMVLILAVGFFIGALGGAFFLSPIYSDVPEVASAVEKVIPGNQEVLYLDVSSATDINKLRSDLSQIEGFQSLEETGITPTDYRNSVKLTNAKRLLVSTDQKISDIALECGFGSASYFSKTFLKNEGISPAEYRKLNK